MQNIHIAIANIIFTFPVKNTNAPVSAVIIYYENLWKQQAEIQVLDQKYQQLREQLVALKTL